VNVGIVFAVALATALATGLGVLPVVAMKVDEKRSVLISSALAAGCMLGASAGLFYEGFSHGVAGTLGGALAGIAFIAITSLLLGKTREAHIGNIRGARGLAAVLVIAVMTVHSLAEGAALGVSFAGEKSLGIVIAIAIAIHNIPEGVAISLALVPHGASARSAAGWSIFSSLPQPLMAVPAYLAVRTFAPLLGAGLGFAGGAMTWMVVTQLLPDAMGEGSRPAALIALIGSAAAMIAFELAIGL
jgi:zinc transporter, ZIP family